MKNKIIIFLAVFIIFFPAISIAIPVPITNLTVVVNTQRNDLAFHFSLNDYRFSRNQELNLQTNNLTASGSLNIFSFGSNAYLLTQDSVPGIKINSILCSSDNPNNTFSYTPDGVYFFPKPWSNINCIFNNVIAKTPVLIVPGLLGTNITKDNNKLWLDLLHSLTNIGDEFMDPLAFNKDLTPTDNSLKMGDVIGKETANVIVGKLTVFDYTDGLIKEFTNQGYVENENLFTFPYDWRYGASGKYANGTTNSDLLAQKISSIMAQTGSDKVDIVAHSLGGLIVKKYVAEHPADNHIGKAVFVGVPNTGAPVAVKVLLQGSNFGVLGLSDQEMKKIGANMPAAYDLLPSQQYYNAKGSYIETIDQTQSDGLTPYIVKDLNHQESGDFLNGMGFNSLAINNAENLHTQSFDNFDMRTAGVNLFAIDGCKSGTFGTLVSTKYNDIFGQEFSYSSRATPGDNTVPLESATNLPIDQSNKYYALVSNHSKMPSEDGIRQEIINLISGSNLSTGIDGYGKNLITQDINQCQLNGKAISVFSPVNIFVTETDQNGTGNKMGLADDGSIINEIPNADFEILGGHKFIYLPQDEGQTYSINMQGTDAGTYTIKSQEIQNSQITKTEVFSNLPVTANLTGQIDISPGDNSTTLSLNNSQTPILPSATVGATASKDILPPVSVATLSGTADQPNFYRSDVIVNLKAADDNSGVLNMEYKLDGGDYKIVNGDAAVFSVLKEGNHVLVFFSTDKMGNNEPEQTINFTIDKTAPEVVIQFDSGIKDLKFTGMDNISDASSVLVKDNDDTITLTDQAGNITEIKLKNKNRKILMSAEIKSLKYNGTAADISKNLMAFVWLYDKNKNLKMLSQHVQSKKNYNILAIYDGKNTSLIGKDSSGITLKSLSGLRIIKITTAKGDFNWSY